MKVDDIIKLARLIVANDPGNPADTVEGRLARAVLELLDREVPHHIKRRVVLRTSWIDKQLKVDVSSPGLHWTTDARALAIELLRKSDEADAAEGGER